MKPDSNMGLHESRLTALVALLYTKGFTDIRVQNRFKCGFDLLVVGNRIEFKVCRPLRKSNPGCQYPVWQVNIHRHGKHQDGRADIYVICLLDLPGFSYALYLIVPAKELENKTTLAITLRSLVMDWSKWADKFDLIVPQQPQ